MSGRFIGIASILFGASVGCADYFFGDHWMYVNGDTKYLYPPTEYNVMLSALLGLIASAVAWGLLELVDWLRRRRKFAR